MIEACYEGATQATTSWILAEKFIHTIYILQLQQPVHRLKMEVLMSHCTTETTQTTMNTTLIMHTICKLQREQPVYRFKEKTVVSLYTNEKTRKTIFLISASTGSWTFLNKDICNAFCLE